MALDGYKNKPSVSIVYTGDGKGKTSAAIGLLARGLGNGFSCVFIQFIKTWEVSEHNFFAQIAKVYKNKLVFYQGGKGFYNLGELSAKDIKESEHQEAAQTTYSYALEATESGLYDLVICDEINVAFAEGLLTKKQLELLLKNKHSKTNLCFTGRGFPPSLLDYVDIATEMTKLKHHFDERFIANKGIDY